MEVIRNARTMYSLYAVVLSPNLIWAVCHGKIHGFRAVWMAFWRHSFYHKAISLLNLWCMFVELLKVLKKITKTTEIFLCCILQKSCFSHTYHHKLLLLSCCPLAIGECLHDYVRSKKKNIRKSTDIFIVF